MKGFRLLHTYLGQNLNSEATHEWILDFENLTQEAICDFARELAELIVTYRAFGRTDWADAWRERARTGTPLNTSVAAALEVLIGSCVGTPASPKPQDHIQGCIAEYLWYFLTVEEGNASDIVFVHGPSAEVTEIGGDGLVIYRASSQLGFRLWEIKKYVGAGDVNPTITRACQQLNKEALRYLAKYSLLGQFNLDDEVAAFHTTLMEHWIDETPQASAGVGVCTSPGSIPNPCFHQLPQQFPGLLVPRRLEGRLTSIDGFDDFAQFVATELWRGL